MLNRRDVMKGAAVVLLAGTVRGQESSGPFREPTARFDRQRLEALPAFAFRAPLPIPLVPRPVMVGSYEELTAQGAQPFGAGDPVPIGGAYHGVAREWAETPAHWMTYGPAGTTPAAPGVESWRQKQQLFGVVPARGKEGRPTKNWGEYPIKCYKIPILETTLTMRPDVREGRAARVYGYAGMVPGPTLPLRLGQPVVVRYENRLDTEVSVHLHGGHSPSHSDGFPEFYVLPGKSRDYFYPNILPLRVRRSDAGRIAYEPDLGESQSTMWYHDHAMDATAYNVSKGLAGFAKTFGEVELALIHDRVLPGLGPDSCQDPERDRLATDPRVVSELEDPAHPGFYRPGKEPYHNPYDIPLVVQDKVIDLESGQIAYDNTGHNGYLGDTIFVNGVAWPRLEVENRKYRLRILNGSNARFYRLRLLAEGDYQALRDGVRGPEKRTDRPEARAGEEEAAGFAQRSADYERISQPFLRIGKDSWLWPTALKRTSVVLGMANRADLVVDFKQLAPEVRPGETKVFYLVNTMPQADGRGPRGNLDDNGDPRVLPLPFDFVPPPDNPDGLKPIALAELEQPMPLLKIVVQGPPIRAEDDASIEAGTPLLAHDPIHDDEVVAVREFVFERGKGAWQINGRFYDPTIANATPTLGTAEEWVLRNGGGGWWHPIHIHLESHQLVAVGKDFAADEVVDIGDPPAVPVLGDLTDITGYIDQDELRILHDTMVLGPNTVARIRMRFRTWNGPFVFHCHNLEHEDMRMMYNFEPVPRSPDSVPPPVNGANTVPNARTHGNDLTWQLPGRKTRMGELPWEYRPVPEDPVGDAGVNVIPPRLPPRSGRP